MNDSDDDDTQLSAHTLAALQEFYLDQQKKQCAESVEEDWVKYWCLFCALTFPETHFLFKSDFLF